MSQYADQSIQSVALLVMSDVLLAVSEALLVMSDVLLAVSDDQSQVIVVL
jgi:nitrate reductase NapAB chaperone NapD